MTTETHRPITLKKIQTEPEDEIWLGFESVVETDANGDPRWYYCPLTDWVEIAIWLSEREIELEFPTISEFTIHRAVKLLSSHHQATELVSAWQDSGGIEFVGFYLESDIAWDKQA